MLIRRRHCTAKVAKTSVSEDLLWVELHLLGQRIFCAVVYIRPKDTEGRREQLLMELQRDGVFDRRATVMLMGDFNARVGAP